MKVYQYIITIYEQKKSPWCLWNNVLSWRKRFLFLFFGFMKNVTLHGGYRASKAKTDVAAPFRLAAVLLSNPSPFTLANQKLIINSNKLFKVHEKGGKCSLRV